MSQVPCARCGALVTVGERFCGGCGHDAGASAVAGVEREQRIGKARKWLMVICVLTAITGVGMYLYQSSQVDGQLAQVEGQLAGMSSSERDAFMVAQTGMTWAEAVDHDRGQVKMLLVVNLVLAALYLGMWFWAKKNALAATLVAFFLFTGTIVMNLVLDPKTIAQGIIVKVIFTVILVKAIGAAFEERRLATARAR